MPKFHVLQNVECREAFPLAVAYIVRLELVSDGGKKNISGVFLYLAKSTTIYHQKKQTAEVRGFDWNT